MRRAMSTRSALSISKPKFCPPTICARRFLSFRERLALLRLAVVSLPHNVGNRAADPLPFDKVRNHNLHHLFERRHDLRRYRVKRPLCAAIRGARWRYGQAGSGWFRRG